MICLQHIWTLVGFCWIKFGQNSRPGRFKATLPKVLKPTTSLYHSHKEWKNLPTSNQAIHVCSGAIIESHQISHHDSDWFADILPNKNWNYRHSEIPSENCWFLLEISQNLSKPLALFFCFTPSFVFLFPHPIHPWTSEPQLLGVPKAKHPKAVPMATAAMM